MKVLHLGKFYPPYFGGIEKVNFDLVEGLNNLEVSTDVLCFNENRGSECVLRGYHVFKSDVIINALSTPISIDFFKTLKEIKDRYSIIHVHLPNPIAIMAILHVGYKGKIIVHWHSDIIRQKIAKIFFNPFQQRLLTLASTIVVTSPNYLEGSDDLKHYRNKVQIIPIGIDQSEFPENPTLREKLTQRYSGKKIIFALGRHIYYKNFSTLIDAVETFDEDTIVLLGGEGELSFELKDQVIEKGFKDRVVFLGKIPFEELGEYFKLADVFCLPSNEKSEAFGVVIIEAMSFGCPVVSCNIEGSGVPWVNQDKKTGFVVPVNDSEKLGNAINLILHDSDLKEEFSLNARARYFELFTKDKMVKEFKRLYESV
ncbi:MAG TPA: glycosyl transferase family 1 [Algoriphagus sp.]|uniref:glycosyltransferase n=1 Tax=Algoriphagus TaxID=246875 RepID=UPI000C564843|nr:MULTISPECIES: glycosyltransferase [Algoriphagus]MAL13424.1 glycosyl transferase family 1 [Algoriphagus sp.]HAD51753.1 glycosyl transferase family 1 [Algoriphagus sp.]HAS58977.1 glycosyl transferase family 1 [Algoriphagus sp.]HCD88378.1 glycosyl transferase family 1 [Algoriphagus sp.]HCX76657.1 glycosyl transferase family 1 [Algoriphagus sp.]